ncbi:hypothetical protein MOF38_21245 [Bacillus haynesii]|nr:hypothetical protein [Bacillus haynesii]MCY9402279.1 hypothetical protein [Bacillus haynesii]
MGKVTVSAPADGFSGNGLAIPEVTTEKVEEKYKKACAFNSASFFIL